MMQKMQRLAQIASGVCALTFCYLQGSPLVAQEAAAVTRTRCDATDRHRSVDIPNPPSSIELPKQKLAPAFSFSPNSILTCKIAKKLDFSGDVENTQEERGRYGEFGYQMMYSIGWGRVVESGTETEVSPRVLWEIKCDINNMTGDRVCELRRGALTGAYSGDRNWIFTLGDSPATGGAGTAIRFGEDPAIKARGIKFGADDSLTILELLPKAQRIRLRYAVWPNELKQEEFTSEGFEVAVKLMLWAYEALSQ